MHKRQAKGQQKEPRFAADLEGSQRQRGNEGKRLWAVQRLPQQAMTTSDDEMRGKSHATCSRPVLGAG